MEIIKYYGTDENKEEFINHKKYNSRWFCLKGGKLLEIQYSKSAMKNIKEINDPNKGRIKIAIEKIPRGDIKKLQGYNNMYRLRVGNYRIIYKTTETGIYIEGVLPRGEAYKKL